jgi:DNA polymerase III epsilon subunit-like protein
MIPSSLINLNHCVLASVDVETTGLLCGFHEIIQIAIVPLDSEIQPSKVHRPFYINMLPEHPDRMKGALAVHGIKMDELHNHAVSQDKGADLLEEWFTSLDLPFGKKLCPLAHNWAFERGFLAHWFGLATFDVMFHPYARDTMLVASTINDAAAWHGRDCPFKRLNLTSMCKVFGFEVINAHDALADALACAKLYREMIRSFGRR